MFLGVGRGLIEESNDGMSDLTRGFEVRMTFVLDNQD